jgi:hypothetical protein
MRFIDLYKFHKGKLVPMEVEVEVEVRGQLHTPATLPPPPGEGAPSNRWIGRLMGPRAGLETEG